MRAAHDVCVFARACSILVALTLVGVGAAPAVADDRGDVRVRGSCTGSSAARLRVRADDGRLRVEFELSTRGRATRWQVVVVRERRLAWRGTVRAGSSGVKVRRELVDWYGSDTIAVRARSGRGETCRATATV